MCVDRKLNINRENVQPTLIAHYALRFVPVVHIFSFNMCFVWKKRSTNKKRHHWSTSATTRNKVFHSSKQHLSDLQITIWRNAMFDQRLMVTKCLIQALQLWHREWLTNLCMQMQWPSAKVASSWQWTYPPKNWSLWWHYFIVIKSRCCVEKQKL